MDSKQLNRTFSLVDIASWHSSGVVELPKVQRGFVWKSYQIEDLWDSLLRRYPIGAFVLFPKDDGKFELLDGQQRATAICLGFGKETFRESEDKIKLFIDLERPSQDDNSRRFIVRAINKSHPWGYSKTDNKKTLDAEKRRKAMSIYGIDDYNDVDLDLFFPYDCSIAIPLNILLDAGVNKLDDQDLLQTVRKWPLWDKVVECWLELLRLHPTRTNHKEAQELSDIKKIEKRVIEIYATVKKMLNYYSIPSISLDLEEYYSDTKQNIENSDSEKQEIEYDDDVSNNEIENLFLRLNAGGTPLRGEELNYSILKAHISKNLQSEIEKASTGFCHPSRLITIAYRLFQHEKKYDLRDGINMKIKPKQFQRTIHEKLKAFEKFLIDLLSDKSYDGLSLLEYTSLLLEYNQNNNKIGLPHLIKAKIADTAPEVMFLLLYRIYIKGDRFEASTLLHKRFLGIITLFMWLGKGERRKDYSKLLRDVWPAAAGKLTAEMFWSSAIVKRAMLNNVLPEIPFYDKSRDSKRLTKIRNYSYRKDSDILYKYSQETGYERFVYDMFFNRDLVLYAQRDFLSKIFSQQEFYLEDTNLPFDWDHISPKKYNLKQGVPSIVKKWYETIGNYRAWPYSLNRSDQDVFPAKKFSPINEKWRETSDASEFDLDKSRWHKFVSRNGHLISSINELDAKILQWSFCEPFWSSIEVDDLRKDWHLVFESIRNRALHILGEWYSSLAIEDIIPSAVVSSKDLFISELDQRQWAVNPKWINPLEYNFNYENDYNWILKRPIIYKGSEIYLYILHSKDENKMLREGDINFGIFTTQSGTFIESLRISEKLQLSYETDYNYYIQGKSTLISVLLHSRLIVLQNFRKWLDNSLFKDLRPQLLTTFDNSISRKSRQKIIEM